MESPNSPLIVITSVPGPYIVNKLFIIEIRQTQVRKEVEVIVEKGTIVQK